MLRYLVDPIFQVINTAGKPATGGYIEVYLHGTRDKYYCASDFDGTLHPFRIPLDSLGSNIILADDGNAYDIYVYNRYGSLLMSRYNVTPLSIDDIAESLAQKKDRQDAVAFNGSSTKTVKSISQNANGVMSVEFEDIDLPQEVPNVDIVSPNNTITVTATTDQQTNTKTFEIDVEANGGASCGWFNSSGIDTVGSEESVNVDRFRISEGQSVIGNGLEFVPTEGDVESGVQFGNVYANAGIYFASVRLTLSWSGAPVNKVCYVAGRQFDFSYNHEERVTTTKLVKLSARTKMSVAISLESDIPAGLRIFVNQFQIFAIGSGSGSGTPYTAGDGIDITDNNISVMFSKGLELNSNGKLQAKVGNGIYCTADGQLTTSEPEGNFIDITNEWEFDNGFRLQYGGVIPGNDNDMRILYSPVSDTVKFTSSCRINKTSSISPSWNVMLRYIGDRFYTTHNAPIAELAPNIGYTPTLGGISTTIGTDEEGTSSRSMLKIAYVGSRETAESGTGLAIQRFFDDGSPIFGCILQNLVLKVHKRI